MFLYINLILVINVFGSIAIWYYNLKHKLKYKLNISTNTSFFLIYIFILGPFIEECIFRCAFRIILTDLDLTFESQIIISSLCFALYHIENYLIVSDFKAILKQVTMAFWIGLVLYQTSFYLAILYHIYYNITTSILMGLFLFIYQYKIKPDNITYPY